MLFCVLIILMKLLKGILAYYKPLFVWSFTINLIVLIISQSFVLTILTKLFVVILFWLLLKDASVRRRIGFYKMAGVSNVKLLCFLFLIDCSVSLVFIFLIKGFAWYIVKPFQMDLVIPEKTLLLEGMKSLKLIFIFYKPFLLWSFIINVLAGSNLGVLVFLKLLLTVFLWYYIRETKAKNNLVFYKNAGISTFKLYASLFFMDAILSIIFLLLAKTILWF